MTVQLNIAESHKEQNGLGTIDRGGGVIVAVLV